MPAVRGNPAEKWARRTSQATADFEAGVRNPRRDWGQATLAAAPIQAAAVQNAIREKRFEKGVQKAGTAKWSDKTIRKGPQRFAEGVRDSESDFEQGFAPFKQVIESTQLPPRGPKGDPKNLDRVRVLAEALHKAKVQGR